tara:strand:+ start:1101 stop:1514 length:414 start_codon:yes stop_codon:yes gene_type:complete
MVSNKSCGKWTSPARLFNDRCAAIKQPCDLRFAVVKTKLTIIRFIGVWTPAIRQATGDKMNRIPNGVNARDPFFERMMDERIATLRAFLRMTTQKYEGKPPEAGPQPDDPDRGTDKPATGAVTNPANDKVIHLRRKR